MVSRSNFCLSNERQPIFQANVRFGRLQKRLLHNICQLGEGHLVHSLSDSLPTPERGEAFHPASKKLAASSMTSLTPPPPPYPHEHCLRVLLRDGRSLRLQAKYKSILAFERFLSRGGGFCSRGQDSNLEELGLADICLTHHFRPDDLCAVFLSASPLSRIYNRLSADFVYRYLNKSADIIAQDRYMNRIWAGFSLRVEGLELRAKG